jgi:hypothetical protein
MIMVRRHQAEEGQRDSKKKILTQVKKGRGRERERERERERGLTVSNKGVSKTTKSSKRKQRGNH